MVSREDTENLKINAPNFVDIANYPTRSTDRRPRGTESFAKKKGKKETKVLHRFHKDSVEITEKGKNEELGEKGGTISRRYVVIKLPVKFA